MGALNCVMYVMALIIADSRPPHRLISAPWARPDVTPMSRGIGAVYEVLRREAEGKGVGLRAWLTFSVGYVLCDLFPFIYVSLSLPMYQQAQRYQGVLSQRIKKSSN